MHEEGMILAEPHRYRRQVDRFLNDPIRSVINPILLTCIKLPFDFVCAGKGVVALHAIAYILVLPLLPFNERSF